MSENRLPTDDPRLTSYALGELDAAERADIERMLADSPAAQSELSEIRELAGRLTDELSREPAPALSEAQRSAVIRAATFGVGAGSEQPPAGVISRPRGWSRHIASLVTIAAMLFVAFLVVPPRQSSDSTLPSAYYLRDDQQIVPELLTDSRGRQAERELAEVRRTLGADFRERDEAQLSEQLDVADRPNNLESVVGEMQPSDEKLRDGAVLWSGRSSLAPLAPAQRAEGAGGMPGQQAAGGVPGGGMGGGAPARRAASLEQSPVVAGKPDTTLSASRRSRRGTAGVAGGRAAFGMPEDAVRLHAETAPVAEQAGEADRPLSRGAALGGEERGESEQRAKGAARTFQVQDNLSAATDGEQSDKVVRFNKLMEEKRFSEAEVIAKQVRNATPEDPVGQVMLLKSKLAQEDRFNEGLSERKAEAFAKQLNDVDESGLFLTEELAYPDVRTWRELTAKKRNLAKRLEEVDALRQSAANPKELKDAIDATLQEYDRYSVAYRQTRAAQEIELLRRKGETSAEQALEKLRELSLAGEVPGTEAYDPIIENQYIAPTVEPLSTFSVDVDTASYSNVRRFLTSHQLPPRNAVRIEELVNYFRYDYPQPDAEKPFSVNVEQGNAPWNPEHRLVRIGLKGKEIARDRRPLSNLVFLVDVSGSMSPENKLPLVKAGLSLLTEQMTEGDRVAVVTYSDTAALRLDATPGNERAKILETINALAAGGSTNGAGGIQLAYDAAARNYIDGGTNRVILCTDGDFNVGVSDDDALVKLIQERARSRVFFSVFGFGMGNLKDGKLEKLADKGNGHYAYVDNQTEAKKVFVDELSATLVTIAKDVKVQVEFNPARVGAYRLIGYENRALATQDFSDDRKDAGEIGAGHSVTALYEIVPADRLPAPQAGTALRYQRVGVPLAGELGRELLTVKLRYKQPEGDVSAYLEVPVADTRPGAALDPAGTRLEQELLDKDTLNPLTEPVDAFQEIDGKVDRKAFSRPSRDFEWAAAVAAFGMILRDSPYRGQAGWDLVLELAHGARGDDPSGLRQDFINLVQLAKSIRPDLAMPAGAPVSAGATADPATESPQPPLSREEAERRAAVDGKYRNLLRVIRAEEDVQLYGPFHDFGRWDGASYRGHDNLPQGHWVYVAPNWYIWGDASDATLPK